MKTTIYANYGVLAHEKQTVYTTNPISDVCDKLTVEIPDSLNPYITVMDEVGIDPDNAGCIGLSDVLTTATGNRPAVRYCDLNGKFNIVALTIIKED